VVLPIPKVSSPAKFSDYIPISLRVCDGFWGVDGSENGETSSLQDVSKAILDFALFETT
jgi:hypothetical protein